MDFLKSGRFRVDDEDDDDDDDGWIKGVSSFDSVIFPLNAG